MRIGRIAGQYAKPRSSSYEKVGDREVLSFRYVTFDFFFHLPYHGHGHVKLTIILHGFALVLQGVIMSMGMALFNLTWKLMLEL